jgi:Uncharacterized protein SCO1/SenC/PrrC, involved in biogenesis of respiratory and photosynthetic systems
MNRTAKIALLYTGVAVISIGILSTAFWLRRQHDAKFPEQIAVNQGTESSGAWFEIGKDLAATNQDSQQVKLSDLRGKVWLVSEFFAICPHCAVRNGSELRAIYDEFKDHPDFHIVCVSVDPETDKPEKLVDYAKALGAETKNWWFLNAGEAKKTHEYMENELKFFGIRERTDPLDIEANGRYQHDLGFILVDPDFRVIGKWPLAEARSEEAKKTDPQLYERLKADLYSKIRAELDKNESPGI